MNFEISTATKFTTILLLHAANLLRLNRLRSSYLADRLMLHQEVDSTATNNQFTQCSRTCCPKMLKEGELSLPLPAFVEFFLLANLHPDP